MRTIGRALLLVTALVVVAASIAPAQEAESVTESSPQKDADQLRALYDQYNHYFEGIYGHISVSGSNPETTIQMCEQLAAQLATLEGEVLPVLQPFMAQITETYGSTSAEVEISMKKAGAEDLRSVGTRYADLTRMLENVAKTKIASSEYLSNFVKNGTELSFYPEDRRVEKAEEQKTMLQWALKFDPNNAYANERLATIDGEIAAMLEAIEGEIDARTWAGNVPDFQGPGTTAGLAKAAVDYFKNSPQWAANDKGVEILAVAVRGPWQVAETNIFGQVIRWRLPIHLAITRPELKPKKIARVYELSAVTFQGNPGSTKKAPPFDGYWVGESWQMRLSNLPG